MADRRVKVTLAADVSDYTADLARAAAQTRGLGDESRKTRNETKGVGDESTKASTALRRLADAAGNAQLAQLRMNEARERGKSSGSAMLALTQRLEKAQRDLAVAQEAATKATGDHDAVQRTLAESMARAVRAAAVQFEFEKGGENGGSVLARGINQGLVRNSPLIVAGISAALAAGAPVAIAGATALFGGIGIAAAAQNDEVKHAWSKTWSEILKDTQADASVLQKTVAGMADQVGLAFREMRPELQDAFVALAPILHDFTDSLLNAAQNALPGIVDAIQNAGPVMDGLGSLLEEIGTGLGQFFEILSQHSGAAGTALKAIGDIVGALLPILGNLLAAGAELASEILPPLASALQTVASVLDKIAPVLPTVAAGFLAFKGVGVVTGLVNNLSGSLANLAARDLPGISAAAGSASGAMSKLGAALPAIGIATAGLTVALQDSAEQQDKVTSGLEGLYRTVQIGGPQAAQAQEMLNQAAENGSSSFLGLGADVHDAMADAKVSTDAWWASLSPLQQANEILAQRQTELNGAIEKYGINSPQAVTAAANFRDAQADVAYQEDLTKGAIDGVTQAMIDQYNQALAATNSAFGYRDAQNQVEDAQNSLADAQAHLNDSNEATRTSTEDVERAGLQLEEALYRQATAAGQLASDALPATAGELEHNTAAAQGTLAELYKMRDQMGSAFPASLQQTITNLEATGAGLDTTTGQARTLTDTVNGVPTFIGIHVDADLGPAEAKINSFINKHWTAIISTNVEGSGTTGGGGTTRRLASGGPVIGPGSGTSDDVPIMGSNGEHMWTAREVQAAGGHSGVMRLRKAALAGQVQRLANGGPVSKDWTSVLVDADMSGAAAGMTAAQKTLGASLIAAAAGSGGGASRWSGLVLQALALEGQPASLLAATLRRMNQESGGNPRAINLWDSNAKRGIPSKGLMQVIDPTFRAYHDPRTSWDIYDPLANVAASMRYALARYGSLSAAYNRAGGYELGTPYVPTTDTYQLHKGEAVLNAREAESYRAGIRSREVTGGSRSGGGGAVNVPAPIVKVYLDGQEWRGMARVEAEGVVVDAFSGTIDRGAYNP